MISEKKIGDVFKVTSGGTPSRKKQEYYKNGTIPWVKTGDLKGKYANEPKEYITELALANSSAKIFPKNTVLLAMYGATIGACSILKIAAATNQACGAILPSEKCDHVYLYYYLKSINKELISKGVGGAQPNISGGIIKSTKIPLPPLDQQKKIAAILDAADTYRQKTKALIKKYDELTQSLFLDMFGDETGSLTELGKVIKTVGGGTPSKDNEQYWNGSIPWASVKDLKSDRLNKTQDFITQAGVDNSATRVIPNGSLIVATRMAVGRAAICEMDVAINQDLKAIQLIGEINITYLLYLFKSKENYFDSVSSGATVKGIKIEHITKLKVNLPEIDLQNQFAERVQAIEAQKAQAQASLAGAEDLFNSLLQRAFKGELV